jgi:hypothetical protein
MNSRLVSILIGATIAATLATSPVSADCKGKVAEIDAWLAETDVDPNTLGGVKMMRDQGAAMCAQGNEAMGVQILSMVTAGLPQTKSQATAAKQVEYESKANITDTYLAGTWCAIVDQEHSQYVFSIDGTYKACIHDSAAGPYGYCMPPKPTSEWLAKFKKAKTVEPDTLVLGGNTGANDYSTFKRGECKLYGR